MSDNKTPTWKKKWLWAIVAIVVIAIAANAGKKKDSSAAKQSSKSSAAAETPAVGKAVKVGVWSAVVHSVADPFVPTNPIAKPKDGFRYITVDLSLTNNAEGTKQYSSLMSLKLKDADNKEWTIAITGEQLPAAPEGNFAVGETKRGTVAFEVPVAAKGLALIVDEGDLVDSKKVSIPLG